MGGVGRCGVALECPEVIFVSVDSNFLEYFTLKDNTDIVLLFFLSIQRFSAPEYKKEEMKVKHKIKRCNQRQSRCRTQIQDCPSTSPPPPPSAPTSPPFKYELFH